MVVSGMRSGNFIKAFFPCLRFAGTKDSSVQYQPIYTDWLPVQQETCVASVWKIIVEHGAGVLLIRSSIGTTRTLTCATAMAGASSNKQETDDAIPSIVRSTEREGAFHYARGGHDSRGSCWNEEVGINFYGGGLVDEVETQQHSSHAMAFFNPSLQSLQRAGLDAHPHALADGRHQTHLQIGFQGDENIIELAAKRVLIEHFKQICNVIILSHGMTLPGFQLKENVTREKGLFENDGLAAIFVGGIVGGEGGGDALLLTILQQLFLPARFCVSYKPEQVRHSAENFAEG